MIPWSLIWGVGKYVAIAAAAALFYFKVTSDAYDRGFAARDAEARETIRRMEEQLVRRIKENENLTPDELDCALKRIRNPKAECGK